MAKPTTISLAWLLQSHPAPEASTFGAIIYLLSKFALAPTRLQLTMRSLVCLEANCFIFSFQPQLKVPETTTASSELCSALWNTY